MNAVILFIIGIPAIEIYLMIKVGSVIGALNTILTDILGFLLIIPVTRKFFIKSISLKFKKKENKEKIIEGVIEEENEEK